jgi:hypothetical protein
MKKSIVVAGALLLVASAASAQVRPGLNEVNVNGHISVLSANDESETAMQLQLRYGHFLSQQVELGALLSANKFEDVDLFGTIGPFAAFHFGAQGATTVPYVGAAAEFGFGVGGDNPTAFGGFAGLKFFVGEGGALSTEAFVTRASQDDFDLTTIGVRLGVSIFF